VPVVANRFRFRRFVTAALFLTSILAAGSGIVLFLRPEGSLARWTGWMVLGLDKKHWEAVHIVFVIAVLVVSAIHLWFNWRPLLSSVIELASRSPAHRQRMAVSWESLAALALTAVIFLAAVAPWWPVGSLTSLRSFVKDGGLAARVTPPVPDADRLTVRDLCKTVALDERQAVERARVRGIEIRDSLQTVAAIASAHHLTPEEVFVALRGD